MKEPSERTESDSWKQFFASGRVEDYLNYVSECRGAEAFQSTETDWVGDSPHAGVYRSNRNHIETDTYR
ncbi:MAG: hypothetical protein IJ379_12305 [Lachnospiraceae bacterium]|nr:hypothetical protein [Lachnospiraceae bacterium]